MNNENNNINNFNNLNNMSDNQNIGLSNNIVQQNSVIDNQKIQNNSQLSQLYIQPNNNNNNIEPVNFKKSNRKINFKLFVIFGIISLLILNGIIFVPKLLKNKKDSEKDIVNSIISMNSFFIENESGLFALFNIDGEQLTDFEFTYVSEFRDNTALVENEKKGYGVISSTGEMIIDYGKYKNIYDDNVFYESVDSDGRYLMTRKGKVIRELELLDEVRNYIDQYVCALVVSKDSFELLNYNGEIIYKGDKNPNNSKYPVISSNSNYVILFYDNVNYVFDALTKKEIVKFSSDIQFSIESITNDGKLILKNDDNNQYIFKYIDNNKVMFTKEYDRYSKMYFEGDNIIFQKIELNVLDENGNEVLGSRVSMYNNYKNYAINADKDKTELYYDGKLKKVFDYELIGSGYTTNGIYTLSRKNKNNEYEYIFIKNDGTRLNDKVYKKADSFSDNNYAKVSDDNKNFYLINTKGEKIGNKLWKKIKSIDDSKDLFIGTDENYIRTLFDIKGKEYVSGELIDTKYAYQQFFAIIENNEKYIIYDVKKDNKVIELDSKPNVNNDYYFTTKNSSKTQYHSYTTGKIFYEE